MGYVDKHLIPNETVLYRTRLSRVVFWKAEFLFLLAMALGVWGANNDQYERQIFAAAAIVLCLGMFLALVAMLRRGACEFAVTNKRVIIKVGLISRRSLEILLNKVEAITVDQGLWGRIFGYGTIVIIGTGGTTEPFQLIADPLEFRRQSQIAATS